MRCQSCCEAWAKEKKSKGKDGVLVVSIGMVPKDKMVKGGKANGKDHMYATGGSVTDNLPNKGLKKLANTPKGKKAVRKMGFDV